MESKKRVLQPENGGPPVSCIRPFVSFIIVNLNTKKLLLDCISSVRQTARALDHEIWVVDNGSSDESIGALRESFPDVKVIENKRNVGFARANNMAIARASGRYLVMLNTDAMLTEGAAATAIGFMETQTDAALCGAQLLNADGTKQNSISNIPGLLTELTNKSLLRRIFPGRYLGKESKIDGPVEVESVIGAFMTVRKKAVEETGMMDEDFFFFLEETDWCLRFRKIKKGFWKVYHHPGVRVFHLQGQTARKNRARARIEYWRSRYLFFRKHRSLAARSVLRVGLFIRLLLDLCLSLLGNMVTFFSSDRKREKLKTYWALLLWHLAGCPAAWGFSNTKETIE